MTDLTLLYPPTESASTDDAVPAAPHFRHGGDSGLPALKVPVTHVAAERIQKLIQDGAWRVGERLPGERQLADQLGVSRVSLRHALSLLETLGYLAIEPGRGAFVQAPEQRRNQPRRKLVGSYAADEVFLMRFLLNGWAAALLAPRITASQVHALSGAVAEMREAAERGHVQQLCEWDARFHDLLFQLCGHHLLNDLSQVMRDERHQRNHMTYADTASLHAPVEEHQAIVDALAARDAEGARAAVQRHLAQAARRAGCELPPIAAALAGA